MMVRIITDALTVGGTIYRAGQVVEDPGDELLAMARDPRNRHVEVIETAGPALPTTWGAGSASEPLYTVVTTEKDFHEAFAPADQYRPRPEALTAERLNDMTRDELRDLAKERGVEIAGNASKAAFIDAILVAQQQSKGGEA